MKSHQSTRQRLVQTPQSSQTHVECSCHQRHEYVLYLDAPSHCRIGSHPVYNQPITNSHQRHEYVLHVDAPSHSLIGSHPVYNQPITNSHQRHEYVLYLDAPSHCLIGSHPVYNQPITNSHQCHPPTEKTTTSETVTSFTLIVCRVCLLTHPVYSLSSVSAVIKGSLCVSSPNLLTRCS